jgi:hypothetical protein
MDYTFIKAAAKGRPDMLVLACSLGSFAVFLSLREKNLNLSALLAGVCGAVAVFTSPVALVFVSGCVFLIVYYDFRRIQLITISSFTAPYLVGAVLWGVYILQAPGVFKAQFLDAIAYRTLNSRPLLTCLVSDIYWRYWVFHYTVLSGILKLKAIIVIAYLSGVTAAFLTPSLRRSGLRAVLLLAPIAYITLAVVDRQQVPYYLVFPFSIFAICCALWVAASYSRSLLWRYLSLGLIGSGLLLGLGGILAKIRQNSYRNEYLPIARLAEPYRKSGRNVTGGSEFGFALGFEGWRDDQDLGFKSGRIPDIILANRVNYGPFDGGFPTPPEIKAYVRYIRNTYTKVLATENFEVFLKPDDWKRPQ